MDSEAEKLITKLRASVRYNAYGMIWESDRHFAEAASLIESLCRERETLREALTEISSPTQSLNLLWRQKRARRALAEQPQ